MSVNRILILGFVVFIGLGMAIFFLPTSVVNSDRGIAGSEKKEPPTNPQPSTEAETLHAMAPEATSEIESLRGSIAKASPKQKANLQTRMGDAFQKANRFDSAGHYYGLAFDGQPSPQLAFKAGNAFYEGVTFASTPSKIEKLSANARKWLEKVPDSDPNSTEAQAKIALTWVNSEAPMKGILKLRELAEKEPNNEFLAYQLGILSFQSGQYDKAVARFEKVTAINPKNVNGYFYLAQSLMQLGQKEKALAAVLKGMPLAKEEDTKASFQEMKQQLSEN